MSFELKLESDKMDSTNNEIFSLNSMVMGGNDNDIDDQTDLNDIVIHMDIREPLSTLKMLLEKKTAMDLKKYKIWLQDAQILEPHKTLVDQCVEGEGIVQINMEIQPHLRRINIVDVLKPTETALKLLENDCAYKELTDMKTLKKYNDEKKSSPLQWVVDLKCQFKKDQIKFNIPDDPRLWSSAHVKHWLQWAVNEFKLSKIKLSDWNLNGIELCNMTHKEFEKRVPVDPGNIFRTHFEILRKCKIVAILQKNKNNSHTNEERELKIMNVKKVQKKVVDNKIMLLQKKVLDSANLDDENMDYLLASSTSSSSRTSGGQIQLWQFLLELLTDYKFRSIIQWISDDGEFRFIDPERVAKLWGLRKSKLSMNYEKLSRALRYYYDGDMISKVHGKRFVYKFVCDLKQVLGYDARELSNLINECIEKEN